MPILLILQRVLFANRIRVKMVALASMTESTNAFARINIMEKPAQVSVIAVMDQHKIYVHNLLYSGSVTLYSIIHLLYLY